MPSHHHSLSHPGRRPKHAPHAPLTPPLTPSSSINSATHPPADVPPPDTHTRVVLLTNLLPTLDPAVLEHTIHQILAAHRLAIKGINTRPLPATHSVPVVFFDSRDASSLLAAVASASPLLRPLALGTDRPVAAEMISVAQLAKDIGPSPFLDSIDASFRLSVRVDAPAKQINVPILQSLLSSFGQLRSFSPSPQPTETSAIYHIEYFDSRDGDRAILDLDGKVLFAMSLAVVPASSTAAEALNVQFPSISTSSPHVSASDVDTSENPIRFGPPGSVSNLRVRFRSLGDEKHTYSDLSELEVEPKPTVFYASSASLLSDPAPDSPACAVPDSPSSSSDHGPEAATATAVLEATTTPSYTATDTPDPICVYCPSNEGGHYPPPPPPAGPVSTYTPDSGIVYYPSLSVTPAPTPPTTAGYEYLEAHYGHANTSPVPAPGWGAYDPMMVPLPMGMNMGMGMVPLPMGVNMMSGVGMMGMPPPPPPPHGYYEGPGGGGGRGYVLPYGHPPPHPQSQPPYQPQYMNGAGVYGYPNQRFVGGDGGGTPSSLTSRSGSGSSVGSSSQSTSGRVPPPLMGAGRLGLGRARLGYKGGEKEMGSERLCLTEYQPQQQQDRQRECSCSRDRGDEPPASTTLVHCEGTTGSLHIPPSTEPSVVSTDLTTSATPPSERNQLNIKRIEEGVDTRTTVMIKNIPNKMSDRDLMVFIERVCPRRIDFFYLRMDFQNGCNVGYAFVNFIHVQDLLGFAKARLGVKWNMFSSEKVLQMSYANYQGKEALVEKFKNSAIMDEREAWRPRIFYSSGPNQGYPEPFPPPTHMRRKERSFFNRGALFVPGGGGGGPGGGVDGRRGIRLGNGKDGTGTEGVLSMRNLSGLTLGKGWMGRTTRNGVDGVEDGEAEEVFGGGV